MSRKRRQKGKGRKNHYDKNEEDDTLKRNNITFKRLSKWQGKRRNILDNSKVKVSSKREKEAESWKNTL